MSFTKTARLNLCGGGGWDAEMVARWLEDYANEQIPKYTRIWMQSLGKRGEHWANIGYAGTVFHDETHPHFIPKASAIVEDNRVIIEATGPEVVFAEFGAGVYADPGQNDLAAGTGQLGFIVDPGTWSEGPEGWHTWSKWINGGRKGEYPYNVEPGKGLHTAWNDIRQMYEALGQLAFQYEVGVDD